MQFDKADIIIGCVLAFLFGMLFALWITWDSPARTAPVSYFEKYGTEICRQRNAVFHRLGNQNYYVCMDKDTKVLSDFD
jgi:hypothetical protein